MAPSGPSTTSALFQAKSIAASDLGYAAPRHFKMCKPYLLFTLPKIFTISHPSRVPLLAPNRPPPHRLNSLHLYTLCCFNQDSVDLSPHERGRSKRLLVGQTRSYYTNAGIPCRCPLQRLAGIHRCFARPGLRFRVRRRRGLRNDGAALNDARAVLRTLRCPRLLCQADCFEVPLQQRF